MPATKALFWIVLVGAGGAIIFFFAFPDYQPAILKAKLREAKGFTPATTPSEAIEKFRECIRHRDYESAIEYTGGPYTEYLRMGAQPATKLAESVDELAHNVNEVARINSPDGKYVLNRLEPFPKDFKFTVKQPISDADYKVLSVLFPADFPADSVKTVGQQSAAGWITFDLMQPGDPKSGRMSFGSFEPRIFLSLVPNLENWTKLTGIVGLKESGNEQQKGWKIYFPMWDDTRSKIDYLKQNYGNYIRGLDNVKYAIKHDAASKSDFEGELSKQLMEAK